MFNTYLKHKIVLDRTKLFCKPLQVNMNAKYID